MQLNRLTRYEVVYGTHVETDTTSGGLIGIKTPGDAFQGWLSGPILLAAF